jgi:serralysin
MDSATGEVRLRNPVDFEARSSYTLSFYVIDTAGAFVFGSVPVTITDVDERVPQTPRLAETSAANDTMATAQNVSREALAVSDNPFLSQPSLPSLTIAGTISSLQDKDFYSIHLFEGELLILDVDGVTGGLDSFVQVFKPHGVTGVFFGEADDARLDQGSSPHPSWAGGTLDSFVQFRAPSSGIYSFSIGAFDASSSGSYLINVSVGRRASAAEIQQEDIAALIEGVRWSGNSLSFSFPSSALDYPSGTVEVSPGRNFEAFNAFQQGAVRTILTEISGSVSLQFSELTTGRGAANLRYAMTNEAAPAAYAYLPESGPLSGSSWYDNTGTTFDRPVRGDYAYFSMIHETGHALGLKHGHEFPSLSGGHDSIEHSVMTYRSYVGAPLDGGGYPNETYGFPQTLMMYDIAALQRIYGVNWTTNANDTVYRWSPTTGETFINGIGQGAPGANRIFLTVWDGGGNDTYDFSNFNEFLKVDLRPGEWTLTSQVQLAHLGNGNYARGNVANALLFNNDPRSLIENVIAGSAGGRIIANEAANRLVGGPGRDSYEWFSTRDAAIGRADTIFNFVSGQDSINLSNIDANELTSFNDSFKLIGESAFSGEAGQLRHQTKGGNLHIFGDVNGDGFADFEIVLAGITSLNPGDVIL